MNARSKADLRVEAKRVRAELQPQRGTRDRAMVEGLHAWLASEVAHGGNVVTFDALPGEPDLLALGETRAVVDGDVRLAITRTPERGHDLTVHPLSSSMERHRFGYRQPVVDSPVVPDGAVAVVLVPALAFDRFGNRLGFGAGYYDRFLARLPGAVKVGIADLVVEGELPVDPFDVPMTHLATVDGVVPVASSEDRFR